MTGKFTPIHQWAYMDVFDVLSTPFPNDTSPQLDRDDGLRGVVGQAALQRLQQLRVFVVGAGALGCELLKGSLSFFLSSSSSSHILSKGWLRWECVM